MYEPVLDALLEQEVVVIVNMSPLRGELMGHNELTYVIDCGQGPVIVTRAQADMIMLAETWDKINVEIDGEDNV